jgi:hypothetical protein
MSEKEESIARVDPEAAAKINRLIAVSTEDGLLAVSIPEEPPIEEPPPKDSPPAEPPIEEPPPKDPPPEKVST